MIENDFNCASMCHTSKYFTFSEISKGEPPNNCSTAVIKYTNDLAFKSFICYWLFGIIILVCILYLIVIFFNKVLAENDNNKVQRDLTEIQREPLLRIITM